MMCARPNWHYDRYGDKEYVEHVLRYYQITNTGGSYPANGMSPNNEPLFKIPHDQTCQGTTYNWSVHKGASGDIVHGPCKCINKAQ